MKVRFFPPKVKVVWYMPILTLIGNNSGSYIDRCGIPQEISFKFEDLSLWI